MPRRKAPSGQQELFVAADFPPLSDARRRRLAEEGRSMTQAEAERILRRLASSRASEAETDDDA